jgi:hypothetical protein
MQDREGALVTPELEVLCHEYGVPLEYLLRELDVAELVKNFETPAGIFY